MFQNVEMASPISTEWGLSRGPVEFFGKVELFFVTDIEACREEQKLRETINAIPNP
jgi:hypothetical protein